MRRDDRHDDQGDAAPRHAAERMLVHDNGLIPADLLGELRSNPGDGRHLGDAERARGRHEKPRHLRFGMLVRDKFGEQQAVLRLGQLLAIQLGTKVGRAGALRRRDPRARRRLVAGTRRGQHRHERRHAGLDFRIVADDDGVDTGRQRRRHAREPRLHVFGVFAAAGDEPLRDQLRRRRNLDQRDVPDLGEKLRGRATRAVDHNVASRRQMIDHVERNAVFEPVRRPVNQKRAGTHLPVELLRLARQVIFVADAGRAGDHARREHDATVAG